MGIAQEAAKPLHKDITQEAFRPLVVLVVLIQEWAPEAPIRAQEASRPLVLLVALFKALAPEAPSRRTRARHHQTLENIEARQS